MHEPTLRLILAVALLLVPAVVADRIGNLHGSDSGRPIAVDAQPMPSGLDGDRIGRLRYRAVLHLTSEAEDFGGFSGLSIDGNRLTAVSDQGHWLTAELTLDENGHAIGLDTVRMGRLCDDDGTPVAWERVDAEEIQHLPGRGYLVSFERHHRLVLYPASDDDPSSRASGATVFEKAPQPFPFPPAIVTTRRNKGMEALAILPDGRLLTFAEELRSVDDDIIGWIGHPEIGDWRHLILPSSDDFLPTGAALLPDGDLLLLMRSYQKEIGTRIRILLLESDSLTADARLQPIELARIEPPATIDNMEAISVGVGPAGETLVYIMSDNNYSDDQRTLLMQFELLD